MTREERELARLLVADPVVREGMRRVARGLLAVAVGVVFVMSVLVLAGVV